MENSTETGSTKAAEKQNESVWEKFKSIFPYLSVFIIILGLLYEGLYYWYFNIDIQDYIGISELLLPISKVAVYVVVLTIIFFILAWLQEFLQIQDENRKENKEKINGKGMYYNHIILIIAANVALIALVIVSMVFFVFKWLILTVSLFGYTLISALTTVLIKKITGKYLNQNIKAVFITALTLITVLIIAKSFIQATVVNAGYYKGTKIYTKDSTYVSDSTHLYIGKTASYYFIDNKDKKSSTIIPETEVTRLELHEK